MLYSFTVVNKTNSQQPPQSLKLVYPLRNEKHSLGLNETKFSRSIRVLQTEISKKHPMKAAYTQLIKTFLQLLTSASRIHYTGQTWGMNTTLPRVSNIETFDKSYFQIKELQFIYLLRCKLQIGLLSANHTLKKIL